MVSTDLPESRCASCGRRLDAATDFFDPRSRPQPGDFSVCIRCGALLVFQAGGMRLRLASEDERRSLGPENAKRVEALRGAIAAIRKDEGGSD